MGVRVITASEMATHGSAKFEALAMDIMEIINNGIEYCELTDFPYSDKTSLSSISWDSKRIFCSEYYRLTKKRIERENVPFYLSRERDSEGKVHVYARFNATAWKRMIQNATEVQK